MEFIPFAAACSLAIHYEQFGQRIVNTLGWLHTDGINQTRLNALTNNVDDWWYNEIRGFQSNTVEYLGVYARDLTSEASFESWNTDHAGQTGSRSTGTHFPSNVTFAVSFRSALMGRSNRGRNFFIGLTSASVSGNQVDSSFAASIVARYEMFLQGGTYQPGNWWWVILSRYHNGERREYGQAIAVTSVQMVNHNLDSMRKRLTGRGT